MSAFTLFENDEQEGFKVTSEMIAATAKLKGERENLEAHEAAFRLAQRDIVFPTS